MYREMTGKLTGIIVASLFGLLLTACGGIDEAATLDKARSYVADKRLNAAMIELKNLLKENANQAEARFMLAQISLSLGDIKTAEKEVRRARDAGWDIAESERLRAIVLLRLGENEKLIKEIPVRDQYPQAIRADLTGLWAAAELAQGKLEDARSTLELGEKIDPDSAWILQSKIRLLMVEKKTDTALEQINRAVELYPEDQDFWLLKAAIEEQAGDTDAVLASLQTALDLDPGRLMTIRGRQAALGLVQHMIVKQDIDSAKQVLANVLKNYSRDVAANYYGALLDFNDKEYDAAIEHLSKVIAVVEDHRDSLLLMGNIYYIQNDFEQATYYLEKATSSAPGHLAAQAMLGQAYMHLGQYRDAEERLNIVSSQVKDDPRISALIGISRLQGGKTSAGISALEAALGKNPDSASIRQELAKAYILTGDAEQAISSLSIDGKPADEAKSKSLLLMANLQAGNVDKALEMAENMKQSHPDLALSYNLAGAVKETLKRYGDARKEYIKASDLDKNDMLSLLNLGRLDFIAGDLDKSEQRFDEVVGRYPGNAAALIGKARVDMARNKSEVALGWLEQARKENINDVESRVLLANFYISAGRPDKSIEYIDEVYEISKEDPRVLAVRAAAYVDTNHGNAALAIEELKKVDPNLAYAWYYDAKYNLAKQNVTASRTALEKALELSPDYLEALVAIGNLERLQGNTDASISHARTLQQKHPNRTAGYLLEAEALVQSDNKEAALAVLERGLKIATQADIVIGMNKIYQSQGKLDTGITLLNGWIKDHPEDMAARFNLAISHMAKRDFEAAIPVYEAILEARPNVPVVMNDLAWLYNETGRPGGLEMARRAHQLVPDNPAIQDTYGWLLVKTGRLANGLATLEDAARKAPETYDIQYHYAFALAEDGQHKRARKVLDKILSGGKTFSERKQAEELAAKLK